MVTTSHQSKNTHTQDGQVTWQLRWPWYKDVDCSHIDSTQIYEWFGGQESDGWRLPCSECCINSYCRISDIVVERVGANAEWHCKGWQEVRNCWEALSGTLSVILRGIMNGRLTRSSCMLCVRTRYWIGVNGSQHDTGDLMMAESWVMHTPLPWMLSSICRVGDCCA